MTGSRKKASAVFFAFIMVTSMVAVGFAGSAAAVAPSNVSIDNSPEVRADNPGSFLIFSFDVPADSADTYTININDLENAGIDNIDSANLAADADTAQTAAVTFDNPDGSDTYSDEIEVTTDAGGPGGGTSTITVGLGTTADGDNTDASGDGVAATGSALQTEEVNPGFSYTLGLSDTSGNSNTVSDTIDADSIDVNSISAADGDADLGGSEVITVDAEYASDDVNVEELVDPSITVVQPQLPNATYTNEGDPLPGLGGDVDITADALIKGDQDVAVQSGALVDTSGVASNDAETRNNDLINVDGYRLALDTPAGEVSDVDTVFYNSQQQVSGDIFLTASGASSQLLADDTVIDYTITEPGGGTLATDDTGNGEFSVSESWDATQSNGNIERLDGLSYGVSVTDGTDSDISAISEESFQTRLDIDFELNGQPASQATPTVGDTVQVSGTVQDGSENAISGYRVAIKPYTSGGLVVDAAGTTTTGNDGSFSFTSRVADAVENPNIDNTVGAAGGNAIGFHLGTHLGDSDDIKDHDTVTGGTNPPHPYVRYQTLSVQPQQANIEISQVNQNSVNFQDTYKIKATDADGDLLDDAEVVLTGEFDGTTTAQITVSNGTQFIGTPAEEDVDDDNADDTVAFGVQTNDNGFADITLTPRASQITANVTQEQTGTNEIDDGLGTSPYTISAASQDGSFPIDVEPDVVGTQSYSVGAANPVNINNFDIIDEVTSGGTYNGPDSIFSDAGPETVEVLPLQGTAGGDTRIEAGDRLGKDTFSGIGGLTTYETTFTLVDANGQNIRPSSLTALNVTGAGVNATFVDTDDDDVFDSPGDETGIVSAAEPTNGDYRIVVRPSEVESTSENFTVEVNTEDDAPVTREVEADGLDISEFLVDGETVQSVNGSTTVDIASVVQTPADEFVNNGRVRLAQDRFQNGQVESVALGDVDGRQSTTNINNGAYTFEDLEIGPRGIDTDNDGIGEQTSELTFTAYQYNDTDGDGSVNLENNEVTSGAVETVGISLAENLQVDYDESVAYSGMNDSGTYTLTRGVEYEEVNFTLTDDAGNPVDLTEGIDQEVQDLDTLVGDDLVNLESNGNSLDVQFDDGASDPANGTYVIADIEEGSNVDSEGGLDPADSFVIGSPSTDAPPQQFQLVIETPDRSQKTAPSTGVFQAADAQVDGDVVGVAGNNVPNATTDETTLNHDQTDNLNTNVSDLNTTTIGIDRVYRVNATVSTALGTPLNGSEFANLRVTGTGAVSGAVNYDDVSGVSGVNNLAGDEVQINNEDGFFQFDIEPNTDANNDGSLSPTFDVEAQDNDQFSQGATSTTGAPPAQNPVVEVYDRSGAALPSDGGDSILAQDVQNRLRIESFPASPNDFVLPDDQPFGFSNPKAENTAGTTTTLSEDVVTDGYEQGQLGFVRVTPTGTGSEIIQLTDQTNGFGNQVFDTDGNRVHFDVLQSNLKVDIGLSDTSVNAGENVTVTLTQRSTGQSLPADVGVSLIGPDGNELTSATTNADGEAELEIEAGASAGTYTVDTRPAGYEPNTAELSVAVPTATISIADQSYQTSTDTVTVESATYDGSDYSIAIHNTSAGSPGPIVGWANLSQGTVEDTTVTLDDELTSNVTVTAMLHEGFQEDAITRDGEPVADTASITIEEPTPGFQVEDLSPQDVTVTQGDQIDVSATINNTGAAQGEQTVEFRVGGDELRNETVQLDAGENTSVEFTGIDTSGLDAGEYTHGIYTDDDSQTATLTVEDDVELDDLALNVAPSTVTANESTDVTVTVTNQSSGDAVEGASVSISDLGLSNTTDADGEVTFSVNASTAGDYPIDVSADGFTDASTTLTVEEGTDSPLDGAAGEYDNDGDGTITASELGDAVNAFGQGDLTAAELGDVVNAFGQS